MLGSAPCTPAAPCAGVTYFRGNTLSQVKELRESRTVAGGDKRNRGILVE